MSEHLRQEMRERLEDFVDSFVVKGAKPHDVFDEITSAVEALREAYDRDPDPMNDTVVAPLLEEPSNDWPAADGKPRPGGK
ncbi:hypothetical protein QO002_005187 [Pararhizobium capsulatum DSM 1112]|uniref:Uncharacterized protein n=1 Tax=Pararhizobium capsulatum DSM 1112 TaxID=1121113 RepID=A0ABU0BXJ6_9HYPH|nr:hypothetical protein [Pararhizobium capsulatum]MDQ0322981.1 hypothetical protein [Pararhizobium capsulatum DSM 1112]